MKKLLASLIVVLMAFTLVGCSNDDTQAKTMKVGVSIYKFEDNFMSLYREEIEDYFDELSNDNIKYEVTIQDAKNDMAEQTAQIDNFIAQKYDVLIVNLVQSTSAATIIEKCK